MSFLDKVSEETKELALSEYELALWPETNEELEDAAILITEELESENPELDSRDEKLLSAIVSELAEEYLKGVNYEPARFRGDKESTYYPTQ